MTSRLVVVAWSRMSAEAQLAHVLFLEDARSRLEAQLEAAILELVAQDVDVVRLRGRVAQLEHALMSQGEEHQRGAAVLRDVLEQAFGRTVDGTGEAA